MAKANGTAVKWVGITITICVLVIGWSITYGGLLERVDDCEVEITELKPVKQDVAEIKVDIKYIRQGVDKVQAQMQRHLESDPE